MDFAGIGTPVLITAPYAARAFQFQSGPQTDPDPCSATDNPVMADPYLNEYVWRYNHRDDDAAMFLGLLLRAARP